MKVVEIFKTICGEGPLMGKPAVFLRLYGCNLNCPWCDERHDRYMEMSVDDVVDEVSNLLVESSANYLVITGGEPLLQKRDVYEVMSDISDWWSGAIVVETNGTLITEDDDFRCVISPKKGSDVHWDEIFNSWCSVYGIKFVVGRRDKTAWGLEEVELYVSENKIPKYLVWLMPLTINGEVDDDWCKIVWDFCVDRGYNYSDRLHVRLGRK